MEVVDAVGEDREPAPGHPFFQHLLFFSVGEQFGIESFSPAVAQGVVERLSIGRLEGGVAAVAGHLHGRAPARRNAPDFEPAGTFRSEVDRASVAGPAWDDVVGGATGQRARGTSACLQY